MSDVELTTMCMLRKEDKVLMINRIKNWPGWAFPGGHLENDESMTECIIREIYEETGLCIESLQYRGITNILNTETKKRHIITNYLSDHFTGVLRCSCIEGSLEWVDIDKILSLPLAEGFEYRVPLFFSTNIQELYIEWNEMTHYSRVEYHQL